MFLSPREREARLMLLVLRRSGRSVPCGVLGVDRAGGTRWGRVVGETRYTVPCYLLDP